MDRDRRNHPAAAVKRICPKTLPRARVAWLAYGLAGASLAACGPSNQRKPSDSPDQFVPDRDGSAEPACNGPLVARLGSLLDEWPRLVFGREARSFSSFDRTGGNSDGFDGTYSELYEKPDGEHVIFDATGPGVLDTLWFTGPEEGGAGLDLGVVRFYLDDEAEPRLELPWSELFHGDHAPFLFPLVTDDTVSTGAFVSFVPVPYARRLIVTTEKKPGFYQAHYETLAPDEPVKSFNPCENVDAARRAFENARTFVPRTDVESVPLDVERRGAGTLDTIQFVPEHTPAESELEAARIRITWDDQAAPAVDVPLGSFFGSGLGPSEVRALPFSMGGGVYESRFRMPFWTGFHLVITGLGGALAIHVDPNAFARGGGDAGYFHATYREALPTTPGQDFEWLSASGAGVLVGTVLTIHPASPATKKWWEGDLRSYANGKRTPGIDGTGHEDDHLGAWSNTFFEHPFTLPMSGEPRAVIIDRSGQINADTTVYRLFPGIQFANGVRHSIEHGSRNGVSGGYTGVAFYYADSGNAAVTETDAFSVAYASARAAHGYESDGEAPPASLTSTFEGRDDRAAWTASVVSDSNPVRFDAKLAPNNAGCFLRRAYDQKNYGQRAAVSVDGVDVGTWYTAEGNATSRWAERDFFVPAEFTRGATAHVVLTPAPDAPPWTAAEYRVLCVASASP